METLEVLIRDIKEAKGKSNNVYWKIDTSEGTTSTFDALLAKKIQNDCIGKVCLVEYEKNGIYWNIKNVLSVTGASPTNAKDNAIGESAKAKRRAEMMICAKDIVLSVSTKDESKTTEENIARIAGLIDVTYKSLLKQIGEEA